MYYGATDLDIAAYGIREVVKDEDVFHGMEMMKPASERTGIRFSQILQDEACAVFAEFSQLPEYEKPRY